MVLIRLNKYLSDSGICSRRKADEHILAGEVKVDGEIASLGTKIDPSINRIELNNEVVRPKTELVYYAVYKPKGVISTASDEKDRKTVIDLVPKSPRVYPIGRLDKDSEGLILLTNDGELTNLLTHPKNEHEKEYEVKVRIMNHEARIKDIEQLIGNIKRNFLTGLMIGGELMKADKIKISVIHDSKFLILTMVIHTGYNRQIRKMCDKIGLEVIKLTRVRIANLKLETLDIQSGGCKIIRREEII
ncbi:MAG: pseudouridine synthase [Patescibacteria group bacterium]